MPMRVTLGSAIQVFSCAIASSLPTQAFNFGGAVMRVEEEGTYSVVLKAFFRGILLRSECAIRLLPCQPQRYGHGFQLYQFPRQP